jgi:hypothetical protein
MHLRRAARPNATPIHFLRLGIGSRLAETTDGNIVEINLIGRRTAHAEPAPESRQVDVIHGQHFGHS